jgi:hypothetical protein
MLTQAAAISFGQNMQIYEEAIELLHASVLKKQPVSSHNHHRDS